MQDDVNPAVGITADELASLRADPRFLVAELLARGVSVSLYDYQTMALVARLGEHEELLIAAGGRNVPLSSALFADDKYLAKRRLRDAGLSVPPGNRYHDKQLNQALLYAPLLGYPVVVKPCRDQQGIDVHVGLQDADDVEAAVRQVCGPQQDPGRDLFLLEKQSDLPVELRVFVTAGGAWAAVQREPAYVVGTGRQCIVDLVDAENARRRATPSCLGALSIDVRSRDWLARTGWEPSYVPKAGQKVQLLGHVERGAWVEDATDRVHPSVVELCRRALAQFPDLPYAGIDLRCQDPSAPQDESSYAILEVNTRPALGLHVAPGRGPGRRVAGAFADALFPETARGPATGPIAVLEAPAQEAHG